MGRTRSMYLCLALLATAASRPAVGDESMSFEVYGDLVAAAQAAHHALEAADPASLVELREHALDADRGVLDWLRSYAASDDFDQLDADTQALVQQDLDRAAHNVAHLSLLTGSRGQLGKHDRG